MADSRRRLSTHRRLALLVFVTAVLSGELAIQTRFAKAYYELNSKRLHLIGVMAVRAGAAHLPADPGMAVRVARAYAQANGVTRDEIVFIRASFDGRVLTITLDRTIPEYVALFFVGLPSRDITVTVRGEVGAPVPKTWNASSRRRLRGGALGPSSYRRCAAREMYSGRPMPALLGGVVTEVPVQTGLVNQRQLSSAVDSCTIGKHGES